MLRSYKTPQLQAAGCRACQLNKISPNLCIGDTGISNKNHVGGRSCKSILLTACARAPNSNFAIHISNFACLCVYVVIVIEGTKNILSFFFSWTWVQNILCHVCFLSLLAVFFLAFPNLKKKSLMEFTVLILGSVRQ